MDENYRQLSKLLDKKPIICEKCSGYYEYNGAGEYVCKQCGNIAYDDYGKVRKFIEENGPAPYHVVKEATGVSGKLVREFLDTPNTEKRFNMNCKKCGCKIAVGTLCSSCAAAENATAPKEAFEPKQSPKPSKNNKGGVHFVVDRKR